jgi:hypothetical protein
MRFAPRLGAVVLAIASFVTVAPVHAGTQPAVRPLQADVKTLVDLARRDSPTVRALLDALDHTDLVVYVDYRPYLQSGTARTVFLAASAGHRYVLVCICPQAIMTERIALLGHELQHAVEIGRQPELSSAGAIGRFYTSHGWTNNERKDHFETAAAQQVEEAVRREVQTSTGG